MFRVYISGEPGTPFSARRQPVDALRVGSDQEVSMLLQQAGSPKQPRKDEVTFLDHLRIAGMIFGGFAALVLLVLFLFWLAL